MNTDTNNIHTPTNTTSAHNVNQSTGPRTPAGKAVSSRNAVTHGLYAAQPVLPHLGEDPAAYDAMHRALHDQLRPRNLMERQYLTLWLDAAWKLQRLTRLEDQAWQTAAENIHEDSAADEDALLTKIERLTRLQHSLRRQMDKSLHMLTHQLPGLFAKRTREDVLRAMNLTEAILEKYTYRKDEVEKNVQANTYWPDVLAETKNCGNELPAPAEDADTGEGELVEETQQTQNPPNEPPPSPKPPELGFHWGGAGGPSGEEADRSYRQRRGIRPRLSASLPPTVINEAEETRQKYEYAINDGSIPWEERQYLIEMIGRERIDTTETGFRVRPLSL